MSSDELLEEIMEDEKEREKKLSGIAYILTVLISAFPYLVFVNPFVSPSVTVISVALVISVFIFFVKGMPKTRRPI